MNNYFTSICLLTHLGVNNIWATGVLNKNRLHKCTIVGKKQPQKKGMWPLWTAHIKQKKQCNFDRSLFKLSEPKRFVRRLNKVEGKYIQEQQLNQFYCYNKIRGFSKGWTRAFPRTRLVSKWKNGGGPRLLICSKFQYWMLFFRMHGCCITLTKMKSMSLCLF